MGVETRDSHCNKPEALRTPIVVGMHVGSICLPHPFLKYRDADRSSGSCLIYKHGPMVLREAHSFIKDPGYDGPSPAAVGLLMAFYTFCFTLLF